VTGACSEIPGGGGAAGHLSFDSLQLWSLVVAGQVYSGGPAGGPRPGRGPNSWSRSSLNGGGCSKACRWRVLCKPHLHHRTLTQARSIQLPPKATRPSLLCASVQLSSVGPFQSTRERGSPTCASVVPPPTRVLPLGSLWSTLAVPPSLPQTGGPTAGPTSAVSVARRLRSSGSVADARRWRCWGAPTGKAVTTDPPCSLHLCPAAVCRPLRQPLSVKRPASSGPHLSRWPGPATLFFSFWFERGSPTTCILWWRRSVGPTDAPKLTPPPHEALRRRCLLACPCCCISFFACVFFGRGSSVVGPSWRVHRLPLSGLGRGSST